MSNKASAQQFVAGPRDSVPLNKLCPARVACHPPAPPELQTRSGPLRIQRPVAVRESASLHSSGGVRVAEIMTHDFPKVNSNSNLQAFVNEHLVRTGGRCFVVMLNGYAKG
jgi:hypothetical protein